MKLLKNFDAILSCILLVALTVVAFLQVLFRFVLNLPLSWTEELVRYFVISLIYVSTIYSIRTKSAIRVELIDIVIKGKAKAVMNIIVNLFSSGVMIYIAYLAVSLVTNAISVNQRSAALNMPVAIMYGVECVCFFLMGLAYLALIIDDVKKLKGEVAE